ncbi:MAG: sensor domain-containing diguanylate cyclase [Leptolyngbyaceae cyanobacterium CSU_1_4]|nr:sensor domain-containing diguanylate cyclase [Leptolyngbyaceae cyanobacterium CSU_1_4]
MSILDRQVFPDFDSAAHEVLAFLHQRFGFDLWMVTRVEGENWIVLQANDRGYGVQEGTVFQWADSFCSQMVLGNGPCIAPQSHIIPAYANAAIGKQVTIGAYVGVPIVYNNGALFGTLCGIHPIAQPEAIAAELPLVELLAKLLSSLLDASLKSSEQARCAEQARTEALTDALSGLYNRRGWDQLLADEEKRCQQYGHPACVISIDLDGLKQVNDTQGHIKGDELIHRAGQVMRQAIRKQDIAARVGGDEFAILCVECSLVNGEVLMERIKTALALHPVDASLGIAIRNPREGLFETWEAADQAMYCCKKKRRLQRLVQE